MTKSEPKPDNVSGASENDCEIVLDRRLRRKLHRMRIPGTEDGTSQEGYSEGLVGKAESAIRAIQHLDHSGAQAFHSLIDLLNGGTGNMDGLYHDDENLREGKIDLEALQLLYGALLYMDEEPTEAAKLAYIGYWHYCEESDKDRNFVNYPEAYRLDRLERAIDGFEWGGWYRWFRWDHEDGFDDLADAEQSDHWTNDYGDPCYNIIGALVDIGCGQLSPKQAVRHYQVDLPTDSDAITELWTRERWEESGTPPILGDDSNTSIESSLSSPKMGPGGNFQSHHDSSGHRYVPMKHVIEVATEIDSRSSRSFKSVVRNLRKDGELKWAEIKQGVDYRIYPPHLPDLPEANRIKFNGEEYEPGQTDSEEAEPKVMTDGGIDMAEGQGIAKCPICTKVAASVGDIRRHAKVSKDDEHRGMMIDESLKPIKRYKVEDELREHYVEKAMSQQEIADEWGCSRSTIQRWMNEHGIPRRNRGGGGQNRVEYALYTSDGSNYRAWRDFTAGRAVKVHQLLMIAEGEDPHKVFSNGEYQVHHENSIPWDNRPTNLELLSREDHLREHGAVSKQSTSEKMYGDWGHPDWNPEFSKTMT